MQKTTTAAGEHKKIKGKKVAVKNESELAAAKLPSSSQVALFEPIAKHMVQGKKVISWSPPVHKLYTHSFNHKIDTKI